MAIVAIVAAGTEWLLDTDVQSQYWSQKTISHWPALNGN